MAEIVCRDIRNPDDPILPAAQRLYESVLEEEERIPWQWLARTPERTRDWQPGQRRPHLVVAIDSEDPSRLLGFGYGVFLPGYGGYVCYLGVEPAARGQGIGAKLFEFLFERIADAANLSAAKLPFIIWESHKPNDPALWAARIRVFEGVGGLWARGIEMHTPNYMREDAPPVRLHVFLRPWDQPAADFNAHRLRAAVVGLYHEVYRIGPDDPLYRATIDAAVNPKLVSAVEALKEA